jgi:hypothetical protein
VAAGAYGLSPSFALAAPVPEKFDGSAFKLKAPEPNAKSGGVLRYGMPLISIFTRPVPSSFLGPQRLSRICRIVGRLPQTPDLHVLGAIRWDRAGSDCRTCRDGADILQAEPGVVRRHQLRDRAADQPRGQRPDAETARNEPLGGYVLFPH